MKLPHVAAFVALPILTLAGCASAPHEAKKPLDVTVSQAPAPVAVYPATLYVRPDHYTVPQEPIPIYENAQFVTVFMDAYENERGEIVLPGEKRVMRKAGHWNMEAARNPERSYIPAENLAPVKGSDGWSAMSFPGQVQTYETVAPGVSVPGSVAGGSPFTNIASPSDVRILGVFDPAKEGEARLLLRPGEVLIPDSQLGYIALPQNRLSNTPVVVPGLKEERHSSEAAPVADATPKDEVVKEGKATAGAEEMR